MAIYPCETCIKHYFFAILHLILIMSTSDQKKWYFCRLVYDSNKRVNYSGDNAIF